MKRTLTIDYDDEVLLALGYTPKQFSEEAKLLIAVKLYELGRLSSGGCSQAGWHSQALIFNETRRIRCRYLPTD